MATHKDEWRTGYHEGMPSDPLTLAKVRRWVKREPSNPIARALLGRGLSSVGRDVDACREWKIAIRLWRGRAKDAAGSLWEHVAEAVGSVARDWSTKARRGKRPGARLGSFGQQRHSPPTRRVSKSTASILLT